MDQRTPQERTTQTIGRLTMKKKKRPPPNKKVPRTLLLGVSWFGKIELRNFPFDGAKIRIFPESAKF
jgi:hypothetical protein